MLIGSIALYWSLVMVICVGILVSYGHIGGIGSSEAHDGHSAQVIYFRSYSHDAVQEVADGIQRLLICMEMLFAAIGFLHAFPITDFRISASDTIRPEFSILANIQPLSHDAFDMIASPVIASGTSSSGQKHLPASPSRPQVHIPTFRNRAAVYGLQNTLFAAEKSIEGLNSLCIVLALKE